MATAESAIDGNRCWDNKTHRWNFSKHLDHLRGAYNDLVRVSQNITYSLPDETTRVRKLLRTIKCNDMQVVATIVQIRTSTELSSNFELVADTLSKIIEA